MKKNHNNSAIRLPRIDLKYPIEVLTLPVIKELKLRSQNVPKSKVVNVTIDDSTNSHRNESADDESEGSVTVMSSHSDVMLRNSGLSLIKSYISDIDNDHDFECSDLDSLKLPSPRSERRKGFDLEADSEIKTTENSAISLIHTAPLDYKFNNLSSWKPTSLNPKVQLIRFKLTQDIMYRERLLTQLNGMVKNLDKRYWKYSVLRIRTAEDNKSLNNEDLVSKRNRMVVIQSEISALIAHIRSLSLGVVDSISKLRYTIRKEYQTTEELSIYYKNQNYLLKIKNDMKDIFECTVEQMHYWIGFLPNTFMIPPEPDGVGVFDLNTPETLHSPKAVWQHDIVEGVFMQWFRAHCERMAKEIKADKANRRKAKNAAIRKVVAATAHVGNSTTITPNLTINTQDLEMQATPLISNNGNANDVLAVNERKSTSRDDTETLNTTTTSGLEINTCSSPSHNIVTELDSPTNFKELGAPGDSTEVKVVARRSSVFDMTPEVNISQPSPKLPQLMTFPTSHMATTHSNEAASETEEWLRLRHYAASSWGVSERTGLRAQGRDSAPEFWCNFNQNPFVVESIIGFAEVFPRMTMIPTVPYELRIKCTQAEAVIDREAQSVNRVATLREEAELTKASFSELYSHMEEKLSVLMGSTESLAESTSDPQAKSKQLEELKKLKLRQQGNAQLLTGISTEYLESGSTAALAVASALSRQSTVTNKKSNELKQLEGLGEESMDSNAFLTESANYFHQHVIGTDSLEEKSFETDANYHNHFKSNILDTSSLQFFRVEASKASKVIEERVLDSRRRIELGEDAVPSVRESCRGKRQLNRLSEQYLRFIVVTIQRWVRGFIGRRRFKHVWRRAHALQCLVRLQANIRGMLDRRLVKIKVHRRKVEVFLLRKSLVRRHRAALILTNAIRQVINKKRAKNNLPLMKLKVAPSVLGHSKHKKKRHKGYDSMLSSSHTLSKAELPAETSTESSAGFGDPKSRKPKLATEDDDDRSHCSAVSQAVSERSMNSYNSSQSALSMDTALREEIAMENEVSHLLTIDDEVERRKWQKLRAIQLVQKVNSGKFIKDTVYTSRLIPMKEIRNSTSSMRIKLFSVKEHAFLSALAQSSSTSVMSGDSSRLLHNSLEVYESGNSFHKTIPRNTSKIAKLPSPIPPTSQAEFMRQNSFRHEGESKISFLLREHQLIKRRAPIASSSQLSTVSEPHLISGNQNSVILSEIDLRDTMSSVGIRSTDTMTQLGFLKKYL
mmetsp:Transcript_21623/g.29915  ORF Transcript_21623/g.29915 Transcript_21623/m.29915 type:complete len:1243 (+) Transcript_21623:23-3751(+)